jgi:hypothetical protein
MINFLYKNININLWITTFVSYYCNTSFINGQIVPFFIWLLIPFNMTLWGFIAFLLSVHQDVSGCSDWMYNSCPRPEVSHFFKEQWIILQGYNQQWLLKTFKKISSVLFFVLSLSIFIQIVELSFRVVLLSGFTTTWIPIKTHLFSFICRGYFLKFFSVIIT